MTEEDAHGLRWQSPAALTGTRAQPHRGVGSSAPAAAARVARTHLVHAARAHHRLLAEQPDAEALHDFRVALRKLRAHLRAHGRHTRIDAHAVEQIERLAVATSRSRDLQVQIGWLDRIAAGDDFDDASDAARAAARTLADRFRTDVSAADTAARETLARDFAALHIALADQLRRSGRLAPGAPHFAAVSADAAIAQAKKLRNKLRRVERPREQAQAHAARIAAKRLRYLLEPFAIRSPRAARLVERLRRLQDALGELHDVHLLREHVRQLHDDDLAMRGHARRVDGDDAAMRELARVLRRERRRLFVRARKRTANRLVRRTRRAFAELLDSEA